VCWVNNDAGQRVPTGTRHGFPPQPAQHGIPDILP
jgi:hypothetical protein